MSAIVSQILCVLVVAVLAFLLVLVDRKEKKAPAGESKKRRFPLTPVSILCLLLAIIMVWGNSSDWGSTKMQRTNFTYANAEKEYTGSVIVFSPKTATEEQKAPAVVVLGGASSYSYAMKSYGIELARRGYVTVLCDMPGQGQSSFVGNAGGYGNYKPTAGQPGGGEDVTAYIEAVTDMLQGMNYVAQDNLILAGFSAGQSWAVNTVKNNPGIYKTVVTLSGYVRSNAEAVLATGSSFIGVDGNASFRPGAEPEFDVNPGGFAGVGSFEDGTANYCFKRAGKGGVQHQMQPINGTLIAAICDAMQLSSPTGSTLPSSSQIYMGAELWGAVGIIALFVLIASLLKTLIELPFFDSLRHEPVPEYTLMGEGDPDPKKNRIKSAGFLALRVLLTIVLYELLGARFQLIPLFAGTPWAGLWLNIWVPFLISLMIVNLVIFLLWHRKHGKPNGGNAYHYTLAWDKGQTLKNIGKCVVLALCIIFIVLSILAFLDQLLTINLKVMIFGMITFNMEHMLQMPAYILLYVGLLLTASLTQYITNPSREDGTEKGNVLATIRTTFIAILPYLVMVTWNTFKGTGAIRMAAQYPIDQFAPLDNMYGYPIMMALVTPIMDMLYRKTKSIWPGAIVCAMLLGVLIASNYSLNASFFG